MTHFPKDPDCPICQRCKPQSASHGQSKRYCDSLPVPVKFGDRGTLDHKIINDDDKSRDHDKAVCVVLDIATYWLQAYADPRKTAEATISALQEFYGPEIEDICKHIYSDNSAEIRAACDYLKLRHDTSNPHVPQTNGVIEIVHRSCIEGTNCALSQSGLSIEWWEEAQDIFNFLCNFRDLQGRKDPITNSGSNVNSMV